MKIISRYINKMVLESFLVVLLIFCSLFFIIGMVRESSTIGQNDYHLFQAVIHVILQIPNKICNLLALICLLAGMLSLGVFATNNELVIFRVSGISIYRIGYTLMKSALVISLFGLLLQEYVAPSAYKFSEQTKKFQTSGGTVLYTKQGVWTRDNNDYIFIGNILENQLSNVVKYTIIDKQLKEISFAKKVIVEESAWKASDISFSKLYEDKIVTNELSGAIWNIQVPLKYILLDTEEPSNLTLRELAGYVFLYKDSNLSTDTYVWVFWDRIAMPFKTIVMLLLSVPVILGPLRNANLGLRIIAGSLLGITFYFFNMFLGPIGVLWQINPIIEVFTPILVFLLVGLYLLRLYR